MPAMRLHFRAFLIFCLLLVAAVALAQPAPAASNASGNWATSWFASQQIPEPANALPAQYLHNATLRQLIHLSLGGPTIRIHISNAFGAAPLTLSALHVARPIAPDSSRIDPASDRALTFDGRPQVIIPAGAEYISDPLAYPIAAQSDLAVTLCIDSAPDQQTGHPGSRSTSYVASGCAPASVEFAAPQTQPAAAADTAAAPAPTQSAPAPTPAAAPAPSHFDHWYYLTGVDVIAPTSASAIVVLGDSITDGHGATTNGNDRWTDDLARRLLEATPGHRVAVLNAGLGGNRIVNDGLGPNALARFDRDVLAPDGVRWLIVHEGVNDLGTFARNADPTPGQHAELVARLIGAYAQMIARAHAHGIKVIGTTILPFGGNAGYHPGPLTEADRQSINDWIRAPGHFDAAVDFDRALADPAHPAQLRSDFDSGDHLHPNVAGYHAMADAVPLTLLQ
jgi:lysophospholipase L1-like esterase